MREDLDLLIKNVNIVRSGGIKVGDIGIKDGKIVSPLATAKRLINASGLYALPGLIDTHMHIRAPGINHRETFFSGTSAAAAGGITTIFEMPVSKPATHNAELLQQRIEVAAQEAVVDFTFYGAAGYDNVEEIASLAKAGVIGFKTFSQRAVPGREKEFTGLTTPTSGDLYKVCDEVAKTGLILAVHAESDPLIELFMKDERYRKYAGAPYYARPQIVEIDAIARAIVIGKETGARLSMCHVSNPEGVELIHRMRACGQEVYIESCLHYFEGSEDDVIRLGVWAKLKPPLRKKEELPRMRRLFRDGYIDMLGSDHAPFTREEKLAPGMPDGLAAVEMTLPILLKRVKTGEFTLERIAECASERPAKIFGIYPRKGNLDVGADADIVLVDMDRSHTVNVENCFTMAKDSVRLYEGCETGGEIIMTIVRGLPVLENGKITAKPGWGKWIVPKK
jgi:dihydropyrimidinase/allantoinase